MTKTVETAIDHYIATVDRAMHVFQTLEEMRSVFAPDATV